MSRLFKILLTVTIFVIFGASGVYAKAKRIERGKSSIDVKIENLDNSLLKY